MACSIFNMGSSSCACGCCCACPSCGIGCRSIAFRNSSCARICSGVAFTEGSCNVLGGEGSSDGVEDRGVIAGDSCRTIDCHIRPCSGQRLDDRVKIVLLLSGVLPLSLVILSNLSVPEPVIFASRFCLRILAWRCAGVSSVSAIVWSKRTQGVRMCYVATYYSSADCRQIMQRPKVEGFWRNELTFHRSQARYQGVSGQRLKDQVNVPRSNDGLVLILTKCPQTARDASAPKRSAA